MIHDTNHIQIGYLQRKDAALAAPIMDHYELSPKIQYYSYLMSDGNRWKMDILDEFFFDTNDKNEQKDIEGVVTNILNDVD